jgi:hypothetical protein
VDILSVSELPLVANVEFSMMVSGILREEIFYDVAASSISDPVDGSDCRDSDSISVGNIGIVGGRVT